MNNERFNELNSLIKGIAKRSAYKMYSRSEEDLVQDLWVKVLDTEKRKGEELDLNLVARICYDYIKDMIDYDQRRNHMSADLSGSDEDDEYADTDFLGLKRDNGNYVSDIMLKDLYNRFPEGSKERIFLDFWGNASGAMPNSRVVPNSTRSNDGYSEQALAKMLGYSGQSSGGYRKFRNKMKDLIADYFGLKEN